MFLLRKCYLLDFEVWALHMSHTMYLPTLTSTTGNMASIKFINNSEFTHDFSWVVVNKGLVFRVMTPLSFPLWIINGDVLQLSNQIAIHAVMSTEENLVDFMITCLRPSKLFFCVLQYYETVVLFIINAFSSAISWIVVLKNVI